MKFNLTCVLNILIKFPNIGLHNMKLKTLLRNELLKVKQTTELLRFLYNFNELKTFKLTLLSLRLYLPILLNFDVNSYNYCIVIVL